MVIKGTYHAVEESVLWRPVSICQRAVQVTCSLKKTYSKDGQTHGGKDEAIGRSKLEQPGTFLPALGSSLRVMCHRYRQIVRIGAHSAQRLNPSCRVNEQKERVVSGGCKMTDSKLLVARTEGAASGLPSH